MWKLKEVAKTIYILLFSYITVTETIILLIFWLGLIAYLTLDLGDCNLGIANNVLRMEWGLYMCIGMLIVRSGS
jgi:hypothetical protein